ncbi:MAG: hypothetical protein KME02_11070 [Aphanothece saxicola GSE-SYN-MK-01-06B]|jgi:hypothetical protein|nr:hypothetical protein [Aphanothece saxicola GSE-SYN-MK-01-06B]
MGDNQGKTVPTVGGMILFGHDRARHFPDADPESYVLMPSIQAPRQWPWTRFRWIGRWQEVMEIIGALEGIFTCDADIHAVTRHGNFPF